MRRADAYPVGGGGCAARDLLVGIAHKSRARLVFSIIRGQRLCLRRRYLLPLALVVVLSAVLMAVGYRTSGFGGMLDPEDRGAWLCTWLAVVGTVPFTLTGLCWVAMRRALFARQAGEAAGIALIQVLVVPSFALWCLYMLALWLEAEDSRCHARR